LGRLKKLKQLGTVEDFIAAFDQLAFRTKGMSDAFFRECFISGLKDDIRAHVLMAWPQSWVDALKEIKKHNRWYPLKTKNPPLSLTLN
jgi:hypothetical protein